MVNTKDDSSHLTIVVDDEITLRSLSLDEANVLFELVEDNRSYLAEYLPWVHKTNSINDSLEFIQENIDKSSSGDKLGFGIFFNDELIGHTSLMHLKDDETPEIGYWISKSRSGRGITKKATKALTEFGLSELGLSKITIRARVDNAASNKIAESLGYVLTETVQEDGKQPHNHWTKLNSALL